MVILPHLEIIGIKIGKQIVYTAAELNAAGIGAGKLPP
jgi:hypothetical protein